MLETERVLITSTSEVYGTAQYVPIDEKHPYQGQSPYSATKIGADRLAESFYRSFNLPVSIVRPFNTFGPRQSARAVIPTIISQLLAGKEKIKLGSLTPTRDFNYVKDTAAGFIAIAESDQTIGQEINIATQQEISIGELAQEIIAQIKNRNYKFIIYMDDLSFEEFEIEYKFLKAVIEGGVETKPDNVLIYATSNRRHLIRETFRDKQDRDEDMHTNDTVQEKLSLVARFGVTIYFGSPDKKAFQEIVRVLAKKNGINMPEEQLLLEANAWELSHGGLSGRTAQQFIDYLAGRE